MVHVLLVIRFHAFKMHWRLIISRLDYIIALIVDSNIITIPINYYLMYTSPIHFHLMFHALGVERLRPISQLLDYSKGPTLMTGYSLIVIYYAHLILVGQK